MYSTLDMNQTIKSMGVKKVELHRKVYADSVQIVRPTAKYFETQAADKNIIYNDTTANAYQEWNIVKKNRLGR